MNKNTSLSDWLTYIEQAHTKEIDMGLSRTKDLVNRLNIDFTKQCVVTVAGTNGKGTTCALIEQVCLSAGLTVGVYSSPHLVSFCERIRLNGEQISEDNLCDIFSAIDTSRNTPVSSPIELTYFEFATLAALKAFSDQKLDVIILEVGLGGRLDAVNVIDADVAVVTSIGLDHQDWLGDTKEKIAFEKAGIFRANKAAIIGEENPQQSMLDHANAIGATLVCRGTDFIFDETSNLVSIQGHEFSTEKAKIPKQNVATALAAVNALSKCLMLNKLFSHANRLVDGNPFITSTNTIQKIIDNTQVMGRHHILRQKEEGTHCAVILDVAHNEDSAQQLSRLIRTYSFDKCHIVAGMLKDKNIEISLQAFVDIKAHWYCASLPTSRGAQATRLADAVKHGTELNIHSTIEAFYNVETAYKQALENAQADDIILVMGSFLTVAAVLKYHASA
ncbi:bifunctional tetrahydrofolate synthase/dihydrofolate synthase [Glaciecola sp. MF2-115]|uniref:bifunctional tetrahydrofolate synthase/dihydrofolate synthase n=1 Tax=Glaciecola sp. MF2-115 TaxID=3384827 RepID=UPI0039A04696